MIRNSNRVKLHLLRKVAWYSPSLQLETQSERNITLKRML